MAIEAYKSNIKCRKKMLATVNEKKRILKVLKILKVCLAVILFKLPAIPF